MQRRVIVAMVAAVAVVGMVMGIGMAGTMARYLDVETGGPGVVSTGTVALAGHGTAIALTYDLFLTQSTVTRTLAVDYRGSLSAPIQFQLPSNPGTGSGCVASGATFVDRSALVGTLTVTFGTQAAVPFCSLYDHVPRTLIASVAPNTVTNVTVKLTAGIAAGLTPRTENTALLVRATNGFTDDLPGTILVRTSLLGTGLAAAPASRGMSLVAAGVDVLDAGADGADCDAEPAETAPGCAAPAVVAAAPALPGADAGPTPSTVPAPTTTATVIAEDAPSRASGTSSPRHTAPDPTTDPDDAAPRTSATSREPTTSPAPEPEAGSTRARRPTPAETSADAAPRPQAPTATPEPP